MDSLFDVLKKYTLLDLRPGYIREFHEAVREAVLDGKLTEEEIGKLETMKEEYGITDDALSVMKQELYTEAFLRMKERADVTDDEWDEMEHIQDFLHLTDKDIARTKKELYRMRILSEVKKGSLPVLHDSGIVLDPEELLHWKEACDYMTNGKKGEKETVLQFDKEQMEDTGVLFLTNKRIMFKGHKETFSQRLSLIAAADYYVNGIILHKEGSKPLVFRYVEKGNHNVVGSVLATALQSSRS